LDCTGGVVCDAGLGWEMEVVFGAVLGRVEDGESKADSGCAAEAGIKAGLEAEDRLGEGDTAGAGEERGECSTGFVGSGGSAAWTSTTCCNEAGFP
jgi:hypothetical protein